MNIRITKEFTFEMAHALYGYDGKCANIHGHSYHLSVTVLGKPVTDKNDPKSGMVIDFSVLKKVVNDEVISVFDHALVLKDNDSLIRDIDFDHQNLIRTPYQPTCENLLMDFVKRISQHIHLPVKLHSICLRETASSYASWFADDNG